MEQNIQKKSDLQVEFEKKIKTIGDVVLYRVKSLVENGDLKLPEDYSPETAMKSAWLILQKVQCRDKSLALNTCSRASIQQSLLDMLMQGLSPAKTQGYFIPYGSELSFQRSYFGTETVVKRIVGEGSMINSQVVYEGDEVTFKIDALGGRTINSHVQTLESMESDVIKGAYCTISLKDKVIACEFMTIKQIKMSWGQSKMNPNDSKSTHSKFPAEMAKRTVINRTCKGIVNTSNDKSLLVEVFTRSTEGEYLKNVTNYTEEPKKITKSSNKKGSLGLKQRMGVTSDNDLVTEDGELIEENYNAVDIPYKEEEEDVPQQEPYLQGAEAEEELKAQIKAGVESV